MSVFSKRNTRLSSGWLGKSRICQHSDWKGMRPKTLPQLAQPQPCKFPPQKKVRKPRKPLPARQDTTAASEGASDALDKRPRHVPNPVLFPSPVSSKRTPCPAPTPRPLLRFPGWNFSRAVPKPLSRPPRVSLSLTFKALPPNRQRRRKPQMTPTPISAQTCGSGHLVQTPPPPAGNTLAASRECCFACNVISWKQSLPLH